jgi:hypothetical protein
MIWVVPHLSALLLFFLHTNRDRGSQDLDFIINYDITDEELRRKGYIKYRDRKNGYSTPRRTIS